MPFLSRRARLHWAQALVCATILAVPLAFARDLAPLDALGDVPLAPAPKSAQAFQERVLRMSREERLGLPAFVTLRPDLRAAGSGGKSAADPASAARSELKALASLYGLTSQEADAAVVQDVQALPGGARLVRLTQQRGGVAVFREQATVLLGADGQALAIGGYLGSTTPAPQAKTAPAAPLDMPGAIARALQDWGFAHGVARQLQPAPAPLPGEAGPYQWWALPAGAMGADGAVLSEPVRAKPVWFRMPQGLVAAYYLEVLVRESGKEHAWAYVVAQDDGRLLLRHNQTSHAGGTFSYRVFADPATFTPWPGAQGRNGTPHPTATPDGYAAPLEQPVLVSLANAPFSHGDPWLPLGATQTLGNNVHAFANLAEPDGLNPGDESECGDDLARDFRACVTEPGVFDHGYTHALGPVADKTQVAASVVNLFYLNNWLHDWFYDAGFNEAAGNGQMDNFGRGGLGGDALLAQALDYSDTNNADMMARADGASSRMRMYRFSRAADVQVTVVAPSAMAGDVAAAGAAFGRKAFDVTRALVLAEVDPEAVDDEWGMWFCDPLANAAAVAGRIVLMDRGACDDTDSALLLRAQQAGAVGVVVVNGADAASALEARGEVAKQIVIPALMVSQAIGAVWKNTLVNETVMLRIQGRDTDRSSALDNGIVAHEWGHFISNRLIGDASGLSTHHARGLGEGWGDFHALLLVVAEADRSRSGNALYQGAYGFGSYATTGIAGPQPDPANTALYGMRRYPYSTDMGKNPLTLRHITDDVTLPGTGLRNPAAGGQNAEEHNMGEVWASMLWECYASLLNAHSFGLAQDRMKRYLVAGYKLTPVNPTLPEARDALLAAIGASDQADRALCAAGFAKRGAGPLALVPDRYSSTNAGVVEDYGRDGALEITGQSLSLTAPQAQRCDADAILDSGETGVLAFTLHNRGFSAVNGAQLALTADVPQLRILDGVLAVPSLAAGAAATVIARVQLAGLAAPGAARITASLAQPGLAAQHSTLDLPLHRDQFPNRLATDNAEAEPSAMEFGSTQAGQAAAWGVKAEAAQPHNRFYAGQAPGVVGSHWMRTPPLHVASTGDFIVSFTHRYSFGADDAGNGSTSGAQLMISTDGDSTWRNVEQVAYPGAVAWRSQSVASEQPAYVGKNQDWPGMTTATVNLGTVYAGQNVRLAWVMHTDRAQSSEGWDVDDIAITGTTNLPFPEVVADAQACAGPASLAAVAGTPQSAPQGQVFGQPLRVRLAGAFDAPLVGVAVRFDAPAAGATALLSAATAVTDAHGEAWVTVTAGEVEGRYAVTASAAGARVSFALRNTGAPVGTGGSGGGPLSISGPAPNGQGRVAATVRSAATPLTAQAYFSQAAFASEAGAGVPAQPGYHFPYGLVRFALENVGPGNAVTLRIQYPGPVPAEAEYWKYGRTAPAQEPYWHRIPMSLVGGAGTDTIEITLTDGGLGDTDGERDGTITDPGGLALPLVPGGSVAIPVLSPWVLAVLAAGLGLLGWRRCSH